MVLQATHCRNSHTGKVYCLHRMLWPHFGKSTRHSNNNGIAMFPVFLMRWQQKKGLKTPTKHSNSTRFIQLDTAIGQLSSHFEGQRLVAHFSFLFPRKLCKLTDNENRDQFKISEVLYTNVGRTYDTTSVVRPMSATIRPIHQSGL